MSAASTDIRGLLRSVTQLGICPQEARTANIVMALLVPGVVRCTCSTELQPELCLWQSQTNYCCNSSMNRNDDCYPKEEFVFAACFVSRFSVAMYKTGVGWHVRNSL